MFAARIALGANVRETRPSLKFRKDGKCLVAQNIASGLFAQLCCSEPIVSHAFSHRIIENGNGEFLCAGELVQGNINDSLICSVNLVLAPRQSKVVWFSLGGSSVEDFSGLDTLLDEIKAKYQGLSMVEVKTGEAELDYLMKWLPYQTLVSRYLARTGFYQSGGAFGFRDQLQDCLALLYVDKALARAHVLDCAAHQFEAGDVQHWWHPPRHGLRTHFVDDRLFLPLVTARYIRLTGDNEILAERRPYLSAAPLGTTQRSRYESPSETAYTDSLLAHCLLAIDSTHMRNDGLVLMKGGDWNDAMDAVGEKGQGVSVWATIFLYMVIDEFLPHIIGHEDKERYRAVLKRLKKAVEKNWDGEWYRRAITDDGAIIGGINSPECKIDLLSQAFAVMSGVADGERAALAQYSAERRLVDNENRLIKLLEPPFKGRPDVGYIGEYPEGVRENGGQYTHAAVWYVMSLYRLGKFNRAYELLEYLNPNTHAKSEDGVLKYRIEPYVIAADVYSGAHSGRGGWSWYTGAAGWYYQCVIQCLFGIEIKGKNLKINPALPDKINHARIKINTEDCRLDIEINNTVKRGVWCFKIDGVAYGSASSIRLSRAISGKKVTLERKNK